jgi:hypothetical protein
VLLRHWAQRPGRTVVIVLFLVFGYLVVCPAEVDKLAKCVAQAAGSLGGHLKDGFFAVAQNRGIDEVCDRLGVEGGA